MSRARNQAKLDGAKGQSQLKQNEAALTLKAREVVPATRLRGGHRSRRTSFLTPSVVVQDLPAALHLHQHGDEAEGAQRQQAPEADVRR